MAAPDQPAPSTSGSTTGRRKSREVRDLEGQGQSTLTWGLPNPTTEAAVIGVALLVRDKLAEAAAVGNAAAAVDIAATLLDKTTARMPAASSIACTRGCDYCCHSVVAVSAPEVFRLARAVSTASEDINEAVIDRARERRDIPLASLMKTATPCPLLFVGECSVYADRPLMCRQYFSTSVEGCRQFKEGRLAEPPIIAAGASIGLIARSVLLAAARSLGLSTATYELSSALLIALDTPEAERRWLGGEDVLGKASKTAQPQQMQTSVERWAGMLTGLTQD